MQHLPVTILKLWYLTSQSITRILADSGVGAPGLASTTWGVLTCSQKSIHEARLHSAPIGMRSPRPRNELSTSRLAATSLYPLSHSLEVGGVSVSSLYSGINHNKKGLIRASDELAGALTRIPVYLYSTNLDIGVLCSDGDSKRHNVTAESNLPSGVSSYANIKKNPNNNYWPLPLLQTRYVARRRLGALIILISRRSNGRLIEQLRSKVINVPTTTGNF